MDTFSTPGMAQGIFHEYLRGDDPISMEARNGFAEGFPFLLAPLSKVKIPSIAVLHPTPQDPNETLDSQPSWNKFLSWLDTIFTQGMNNFIHLSISFDQYREQESDRFSMMFESLFRGEPTVTNSQSSPLVFKDDKQVGHVETARHLASFSKPASDELTMVSVRPKMTFSRRIFIITVHFYLVLLLIVSIPDSFPTKVIITKKSPQLSSIDSESDNEDRNEHFGDDDSINSMNPIHLDLEKFESQDIIADFTNTEFHDEILKKPIQKALSYCL